MKPNDQLSHASLTSPPGRHRDGRQGQREASSDSATKAADPGRKERNVPRCDNCGKVFHHSLILADGSESKQCMDCTTRAEGGAVAVEAAPQRRTEVHRRTAPKGQGETPPPSGDGEHVIPRHRHHNPNEDAKKGWMAMAALSVVALILFYVVWSRDSAAREMQRQEAETMTRLLDELQGLDVGKPADARVMVGRIEATQDIWRSNQRASDVQSYLDRATATVRAKEASDKIDAGLKVIDEALAAPTVAAAQLMQLREQSVALIKEAYNFSVEYGARAAAMHGRVAERLLQTLHDDAKTQSGVEALPAFALAERTAVALEAEASTYKAALPATFAVRREQVTAESDALAQQLVTEEFLRGVASEDLLGPKRQADWRASNSPGLKYSVQGGVMTFENTATGSGSTAILVLGAQEGWRDFALEFECTLTQGQPTLFVRLAGVADGTKVPNARLGPDGDMQMPLGEKKHGRIEVVGDRMVLLLDGAPTKGAEIGKKGRVGGIGIAVPGGCRAMFTRLSLQLAR